ncbi:MAG: WYL domain-containing protein [bacterium]|nr:WYL domain-containing protein [bacterium]
MKNLNAFFRLIAIDKSLKTGDKYTYEALSKICKIYIESEHYPTERTIRYDIETLKDRLNAPIESLNGKCWYTDTKYSFLNLGITPFHADALKELLSLIDQFTYLPHLQNLSEIIITLEKNLGIKGKDLPKVIQLDNQIQSVGNIHIQTLYKAICDKKVISFRYQPFKKESENNVVVHPYFLKEYNNRWYLMGRNENNNEKKEIFGLERIVGSIDEVNLEFKATSINYMDYFNKRVGISKADGAFFKKIFLAFTTLRGQYVLSKPIHHTQKHINYPERPEKTVITIDVYPNRELWALILSFGEDVEVIKPAYARKQIYNLALKLIENNKIE